MPRTRLLIKAETDLPYDEIDALAKRLVKLLEAEPGLEAIVLATADNSDPPEIWTQNLKS